MVRLLWGTNQGGHEVGDVTGPQIQLPDPLHLPAQLLTFPLGPPRQTVAGSWAGGDEVRGQPLWQPPPPQLPSPSLTHSAPPFPAASTPPPTAGKPSQKGQKGSREKRNNMRGRSRDCGREQTDRQMENDMVQAREL